MPTSRAAQAARPRSSDQRAPAYRAPDRPERDRRTPDRDARAPDRARRTPDRDRERRRRELHLRARRRDLLQDLTAALVVFLVIMTATPGLGVVAIFEAPVVFALVAAVVIRRVLRHRRSRVTAPRAARTHRAARAPEARRARGR